MSTFGTAVLACTPAHAPDYSHRYHLFVDELLPLKWIRKGADDWTRVTGYAFDIRVIEHDEAMNMSNGPDWPKDMLIMLDAEELSQKLCQPDVACFKGSTVYFFSLKIMGDPDPPAAPLNGRPQGARGPLDGSWDRVPAHEIGHFLGLDHIENRRSIMRYRTDLQAPEPTLEDGKLVNPN